MALVDSNSHLNDCLKKCVDQLAVHRIPYTVVGGLAIKAWIQTVEEDGYRSTPNIDLLIRRCDLESTISILEPIQRTLHWPNSQKFVSKNESRNCLHLIVSNEKLRENDLLATPCLESSTELGGVQVLNLDALVMMKLDANRTIDRVHLHDLCDFNLVDKSWLSRLPALLADRLKQIVDNPESLRGIINASLKKV